MNKKETEKIELRVPNFNDLEFRKKLYCDKSTTKCFTCQIDFSDKSLKQWFAKWVEKPDKRFYAYIIDNERKIPVGDVNYHYDLEHDCFMIGVVILASERGNGFAQSGLKLLIEKAKNDGIDKICNFIPRQRKSAIHIHEKLGFVENKEKSDTRCVFLELNLV